MFTISQPDNPQEEQSSPELKFKDTLDTITPILSKSPPDRTEQELRRLTIFLTRFAPFASFWDTLSQDLQPYLLREFRYIEVKPNKSVFFLGGPIQCLYFLLKGSVCAFKTPSLEEKLRNDRASFPSYVKRRENVLKRPMTASVSPCNSFSPAKHTVALKTEDIMAQNPDHQYIRELKEGEGFGELVSDTFNPKKNALITKETCHFLVLSATAYKRIQSNLNKYLQSQTTGLLRKLTLLKDWNTGDLSDLFLHTNSVNLGRNHVLYNIGDSCDHVYIVQDGEVEIIKEMTLDLEDEEIFDKRSIVKQSKDIDRSRLVELNPKWKKKFTMARKQQIRVALLGSGQSFGEEEFTQGPLPTARYTKAIVKSLTAKILMVPVDKIFKNAEAEAAPPVIRSFTQPLSISEALVTETEAPKVNVSINPETQEDDNKHRKSVSIGTLAHKFQKSLAISNDTLLVNRLAMLNNFGITYENQPAPEDNKENIEQNSRKKSFVCKSPKNETIPTSKSPIRIAGIKRLWESNVQAYYPKGKKPDQAKHSPQVDRKIKYSFNGAPEKPASLNSIGITTLTTRYVSQPFIMNTFGVTATKSFRAFSPAEQLTTSLGHQTLLGESKEMDDETLKNINNVSHKKRESKIVFKKRSDVTASRKTSIHLMKGLSKVMSPVNGFKEKSMDLNKVTFGETITSRNIAKSTTQVVTMQMNTPY